MDEKWKALAHNAAQTRVPATDVILQVMGTIRRRRQVRSKTIGSFAIASGIAAAVLLMAAIMFPDEETTHAQAFEVESYVYADINSEMETP